MKLIVTIDLDNAAFQDDGRELQRVLQRIAVSISTEEGLYTGHQLQDAVRDSNGNTCGSWEVREYVELTPDEVLSVKDRMSRGGESEARRLVVGDANAAGGWDDRKVRVLAEVRS